MLWPSKQADQSSEEGAEGSLIVGEYDRAGGKQGRSGRTEGVPPGQPGPCQPLQALGWWCTG